MPQISRHQLAKYAANQLAEGQPSVDLANQLAAYLIEHKQTKNLDLLYADVATELENRGIYGLADVSAARPLTDSQRSSIKHYLQTALKVDKIELRETTDPSLIGGMNIQTATARYDTSIRTQLNKLKKA